MSCPLSIIAAAIGGFLLAWRPRWSRPRDVSASCLAGDGDRRVA